MFISVDIRLFPFCLAIRNNFSPLLLSVGCYQTINHTVWKEFYQKNHTWTDAGYFWKCIDRTEQHRLPPVLCAVVSDFTFAFHSSQHLPIA